MNTILLITIIILIVYIICNNSIGNNLAENMINTQTSTNLNIEKNNDLSSIVNFNLPNEIKYKDNESLSYMPNEITSNINLSSIQKELNYNSQTFNLIGTAVNKLYNQKYYLYESKNDQSGDLLMRDNLDYLNEQIYNYKFINFINNQPIIHQEFGPRPKIDIGDIIYLDIKHKLNGISYIGPFIIL